MELTEAIDAYVRNRVDGLAKLVKRLQPAHVSIEVGKPSEHHQKGDVFMAEFHAQVMGHEFHATATTDNLYKAIDAVQEELRRQINDWRKREHSVGRRAARSFKKFLRFGKGEEL